MSLCIAAGGTTLTLAVTSFTLAWTHSVERVEWRETWAVSPAGLAVTEARVRGSGAGMEPPAGARREDGWWVYAPGLPPRQSVLLAASGATGGGWTFCAAGACRDLGASSGDPVRLSACPG